MEDLSLGARKASFQKDCLRLTRDVAQLGLIYQAEAKNERANRAQRVLHMKNQNRVGATAIAQFMDYNIHICAGRPGELEVAADKAHQLCLKCIASCWHSKKLTCQWVCAPSSLSFKYCELPMSQEHTIERNPCPLFSNFLSSAPQQLVDSSSKSWLRMMTGLQTLFGLISPSLEESPALT